MTLDIDIKPGSASEQILTVRSGADAAELPVKVIKGKLDGPVFSIIAGIHGYEYPPIIAAQEIMAEIDPGKLKGTLIIVPIANTAAFFGRSVFYNPLDGKNLNRVFPGKPDGSISEQLAHAITIQVIQRSTVLLDIHAGDASEDLTDFICYYDNKDTPGQTSQARKLAESAGFPLMVIYPFNLSKTQPAEYAFKHATQQGITALSMEAGKLGGVQNKSVEQIKTGIYNILVELGMYKTNRKPVLKPVVLNGQHYIKSPAKGIFYSDLKSGDQVVKRQKIGYITDVFGKQIADINADQNGIILYKVGTPPVNEGETLLCIGYTATAN
ncbi:succinylglutamate desuccinylase/aspartoacylase family protein [Dyadobacter alkalitolerans]|uniref:succinylglutamate desuccinylase/aspartoacylase family protein n=1 Tax=Dyadobacter alkalitolerans TaxID=492736 RepID=UPI001E32D9E5|nr:M14 family metallopeptidase [Dyadobacter alkalitolerans]